MIYLLNPYTGIYRCARLAVEPDAVTFTVNLLDDDVKILRDELAVPFIYADSDRDLYFALGNIQANDRFF